jgi:hypothetical protein
MSTFHKAQRRGFVKGGGTTYTCRCCKRTTRPTGTGDNDGVRLCVECFDLGGEENHLSDTGELYSSKAQVQALIDAVVAKGGDPAAWSDLQDKIDELGPGSCEGASLP